MKSSEKNITHIKENFINLRELVFKLNEEYSAITEHPSFPKITPLTDQVNPNIDDLHLTINKFIKDRKITSLNDILKSTNNLVNKIKSSDIGKSNHRVLKLVTECVEKTFQVNNLDMSIDEIIEY